MVEDAVPKYPVPETESAVEDAYGKMLACDVDVALKYCAVGVVVAPTTPLAFTARIELARPVSVSAPVEEKLEVAVPPKYAGPYEEKRVLDAPAEKSWSADHVLALVVPNDVESVFEEKVRPLPTAAACAAPVALVERRED